MKSKKTKFRYERHLNDLYSDTFSQQEAVEHFDYFKCRPGTIANAHTQHTLGTLLRRKDPIGFNVGFNDWRI